MRDALSLKQTLERKEVPNVHRSSDPACTVHVHCCSALHTSVHHGRAQISKTQIAPTEANASVGFLICTINFFLGVVQMYYDGRSVVALDGATFSLNAADPEDRMILADWLEDKVSDPTTNPNVQCIKHWEHGANNPVQKGNAHTLYLFLSKYQQPGRVFYCREEDPQPKLFIQRWSRLLHKWVDELVIYDSTLLRHKGFAMESLFPSLPHPVSLNLTERTHLHADAVMTWGTLYSYCAPLPVLHLGDRIELSDCLQRVEVCRMCRHALAVLQQVSFPVKPREE